MVKRYQTICFHLIDNLQPRTKDVVARRFGLRDREPQTLEAIGKMHSITRERVRQIVEDGISQVKKTARRPKHASALNPMYEYFEQALTQAGHVKREDLLLELLKARDAVNHVIFLLTLGDQFLRHRETDDMHAFWTCNQKLHEKIPALARGLVSHFEKRKSPARHDEVHPVYHNEILTEHELKGVIPGLVSLLEVSKHLVQGYDGKWGLKWWAEVNPRGMKDKAYLMLKHEGKPLHFLDVAKRIKSLQQAFPRGKEKAVLPQTVHNELIKDSRFVLVGRGTYALSEWGYRPGTVKDVIVGILKEHGTPLCKEDIVKKTLEQRQVKETTVLLNLQDHGTFVKTGSGTYFVAKV